MPTTRFWELFGISERTYRRWQAKARVGQRREGSLATASAADTSRRVVALATKHPAWGHRKIWAMARH